MPKYYSQYKLPDGKIASTRIVKSINQIQSDINKLVAWKKYVPDEIIVLVNTKNKGVKIHGYYKWSDSKLVLDKTKPAEIHNALYGLH